MRLPCVHCGERSHAEFSYLGEAKRRPAAVAGQDAAAMFDYVYIRDNPPGLLSEFWQHTGGCRAWLVVERNISTHEVVSVRAARGRASGERRTAPAEEAIR